jgi:HD-GYP domain-containing protein (c-di-GMP phosphodiesterase class II)
MSESGPGAFLRTFASAVRAYGLYPSGHPILEEKIDELNPSVENSRTTAPPAPGGVVVFLIHEDSFFVNDKLLPKESITFQWFMRHWQSRAISSITIGPGVSREDLSSLVDFVAGEGAAPFGAVEINEAKLRPADLTPRRNGASMQSVYSDALDLTRELGVGLERGAAPPLGATKDTVERLVNGVLSDPDSALLMSTMHSHDEYTFFHMVNVCILSVATGAAIGLAREQLTVLGMGGLLHDIGKVGVPSEILNRSGPLSDTDWGYIRRHPAEGAGMLLRSWSRISPLAARVAYEHHVRLDHTGYPREPVDGKPDLLSRIVTVVDTFDAMTSRRPYRRADQRQRALDVLVSGSGSHYDPRVVRVFLKMLGFYPPGSVVRLADGSVAVVVRNNPDALDSPVVKIVKDAAGQPQDLELEVNLASSAAAAQSIAQGLDQSEAGLDPADLIYPVEGNSSKGSS